MKKMKPERNREPRVKTSLDLPERLWKAAKFRAAEERTDLRSVLLAALEAYLTNPRAGG